MILPFLTPPKADDSPVANSDTEQDSDLVTSARAQHCPQGKASALPSTSHLDVPLPHNRSLRRL